MNVSILIATCGEPAWAELAMSRAYPSALGQGALEIIPHHVDDATVAEVRNAAAVAADGEWLCFLDADDELEPGYVEAMAIYAGHLADGREGLLPPAIRYVRQGRPDGGAWAPAWSAWPNMNVCCIGTLIRRDFFLGLGGFRELPSLEDYDLALRAVKAGAEIFPALGAIYRAHVRAGSRNSDQSVYAQLREEHAEVWAR